MFLLGQTTPNYLYLSEKCGIKNLVELKKALQQVAKTTNLKLKSQDFEHLLFNKDNTRKVLMFGEFVENFLS